MFEELENITFGIDTSAGCDVSIGKNLLYCADEVSAMPIDKNILEYVRYFNVAPKTKVIMIKKVIFNDPATIIIWSDNTKTIVKCSKDDTFDPEKGLAMAICKRALGDKFKKIFKEWIPEEEEVKNLSISECIETIKRGLTFTPISLSFGIDNGNKKSLTYVEVTNTDE